MLSVFGDFDPAATAGWVASAAVNVFALYVAFRKRRVVDKKEDINLKERNDQVEAKGQQNAIDQWRAYIRAREAQHRADIDDLRNQLNEYREEVDKLRDEERKNLVIIARQEEKIGGLEKQVAHLNSIVERRKIAREAGGPPTSKSMPKVELPIVAEPGDDSEDGSDQP